MLSKMFCTETNSFKTIYIYNRLDIYRATGIHLSASLCADLEAIYRLPGSYSWSTVATSSARAVPGHPAAQAHVKSLVACLQHLKTCYTPIHFCTFLALALVNVSQKGETMLTRHLQAP